jgi:hypothetical protein
MLVLRIDGNGEFTLHKIHVLVIVIYIVPDIGVVKKGTKPLEKLCFAFQSHAKISKVWKKEGIIVCRRAARILGESAGFGPR